MMSCTECTMSINFAALTDPSLVVNRECETVLTWCAIEKLVFVSPPSGGFSSTIAGDSLPDFVYQPVPVKGTTMLKPILVFIWSLLMTTHGRILACSCP